MYGASGGVPSPVFYEGGDGTFVFAAYDEGSHPLFSIDDFGTFFDEIPVAFVATA